MSAPARRRRPLWVPVCAVLAAVWALWVLEGARSGLSIQHHVVEGTPVTQYGARADGGPPVVIAHGFAGSRQMMQGYALGLAQAGYTVFSFDFEGHGAHATPMSGDVTRIDGTTRLLVAQTRKVIDFAVDGAHPVALLGHSMATDVLVRVAGQDDRTGPLVLLSAFSKDITQTHPGSLLLISGAWEPGLAAFALQAVQMVDPTAMQGETAKAGDVSRRAVLAPWAEHVSILQSRAGRAEALAWLNAAYGRTDTVAMAPTGWALIVLLAAITALAAPVSRMFAPRAHRVDALTVRQAACVFWGPALAAPLLAYPIETHVLPVLIADYLALHLAIFGAVQLGVLVWFKRRFAAPDMVAVMVLLAWGIGVFGLALDRYGANFWPPQARLPIIAALTLGAVPFMLGDAMAAYCAPLWQRIMGRVAVLASLGIAVSLNFEDLFFLIMIAPVIVLFLLTFGLMGRAFALRSGPVTAGLALGLVLAWALGVSFPLFSA